MQHMFHGAAAFNQDISTWNVARVTDMQHMFHGAAAFHQSIISWDVSSVTNMQHMFDRAASFNVDISSWNVSSVTAMQYMFFEANAFSQILCGPSWVPKYSLLPNWVPSPPPIAEKVCSCPPGMLLEFDSATGLDICTSCPAGRYQPNYNVIKNTTYCLQCEAGKFSEEGSQHCKACPSGKKTADSAHICAETCQRHWSVHSSSGDTSCTVFSPTFFCDNGYCDKYLERCTLEYCEEQYGEVGTDGYESNKNKFVFARITLRVALQYCTHLTADGPDEKLCDMTFARRAPKEWDVSKVQAMNALFYYTGKEVTFNQDISKWDTAQVTTMSEMFRDAVAFNQDISKWNTAQVTDMQHMFHGAAAFNQDISTWNTAQVTDMQHMFHGAAAFNQDISKWNTARVTTMAHMFHNATYFNQLIRADEYSLYKGLEGIWDLRQVSDMTRMFYGASAFQMTEQTIDGIVYNIHTWDVPSDTITTDMFVDSGLRQNPSWYSS